MEGRSPFEGPPFPKLEEIDGEARLLLLSNHRTNRKQDDTQGVRLYHRPRLLSYRNSYPEENFQNTPTNSGFISFRYFIFTQCKETKTFPEELEKVSKRPYDFKYAQTKGKASKQLAVPTSHLSH